MTAIDLDAIEKRAEARWLASGNHADYADNYALVAEVRRLRALPVLTSCSTCRYCVGFGNVSRKTGRFVGAFHCEHRDATRDEGSAVSPDGKRATTWSRPPMVEESAPPPSWCPLRGGAR